MKAPGRGKNMQAKETGTDPQERRQTTATKPNTRNQGTKAPGRGKNTQAKETGTGPKEKRQGKATKPNTRHKGNEGTR